MITILDTLPKDRHVVSASQIKTYQRCPRKWGFKYIDKLPDPVGKGAIFGNEVHHVFEQWFTDGIVPDENMRAGKLAAHGLRSGLYPDREGVENVERHIAFEADGVLFQGYIDLEWLTDFPVICDHKTSSDPKKYALTEDELPTDTQALIYATWGHTSYKTDVLQLQWVYLQTAPRKTPKVFPIRATMDWDTTHESFRLRVLPSAKAIVQAKVEHTTGNDLEPNTSACGDFGGCPFADFCTLNREQKLSSVFGETDMPKPTLREMIAARKGGKLPPPRVNSPEHTAGVAAAQEVSRAVEKVTGGAAAKKETVREIANAASGETDPAAAKEKAEAALSGAENDKAARKSPSLTQAEILARLKAGDRSNGINVSCSKPKASTEVPYVAGRTLSTLVKNKLVVSVDCEDGTKQLTLTGGGLDEAEKVVPGKVDGPIQTSPVAEASVPPKTEPEITMEQHPISTNHISLDSHGPGHLVVLQKQSTELVDATERPEHAEFLRELLREHGAEEATERFDAYCRYFK